VYTKIGLLIGLTSIVVSTSLVKITGWQPRKAFLCPPGGNSRKCGRSRKKN